MVRFRVFFMTGITCVLVFLALNSQAQTTPYTITLEEVTYSDWPGAHSFAFGEWEGNWLLLAGRTGGLHGFLPPNPFTVLEANNKVLMLNPETGEQWSAPINTLPDALSDQLRATNPEFFQRGKYLYIVGGYGKDSLGNAFVTFPSLIAVDLELLSDALINNTEIVGAFRQFEDTLFCVTGAEIQVLPDDETVYIFGGHVFSGEYTKPASDAFIQTYTDELRKFVLQDDGINISISDVEHIQDTAVFHRRDLNFKPIVNPDESFGMVAFAGVFQYEADWAWFNPVYVSSSGYTMDIDFIQKLNAYTCPVMPVFDSVSQNYFATFFGGISQFYHNEISDTIKEDLNVPFINDISTVIKYADGTTEQILEPIKFDALLGSNAIFILNEDLPHYANQVIQLHKINGTVLGGYIYGGIDALVPNFTPSSASNRLFKVWINYENPLDIAESNGSEIQIFPNPADGNITIRNTMLHIFQYQILNSLGEVVLVKTINLEPHANAIIATENLHTGMYFLRLFGDEKVEMLQFVKK